MSLTDFADSRSEEDRIRALVREWQTATAAGDTEAVLALMTEDAEFLTVGREPMGKAEFAAISRPSTPDARPRIEIAQDIAEILVSGDLACMRSSLAVTITPPEQIEPVRRSGTTLTIFRKVDGDWRLAPDANLL